MTITILTPTGQARIDNAQSKQGLKALTSYIHAIQGQNVPFIVLPPKTHAHDLVELTSVYNMDYYG